MYANRIYNVGILALLLRSMHQVHPDEMGVGTTYKKMKIIKS